ncbi:Acetyl-/propionyl-coenzyme A carboxylase alpha chain [Zhongshania aliphaticivorans]|uniref:Biotin carboxylase n=1 Tax=Zhongshania aliphaticivorans TaxID=1470434 RepID=A0A5S9NC39_9GAMM|nr:urea carboxylase [Zhongshania aliphaticivorans]CAA0080130.1 Acetyl-/propionyl-coenzyme A carboxylase alpha chain [Zhongshania aliphaticivorans]CAA0085825.1 Acetyl-/propionyl-coenzyme A carboxylase alpha chain [Zhongshania aliphaticivorans]
MFQKVLIANRGAIATRIIRTLKQFNITAVAVYAEADARSLHVRDADEAYSLGDGGAADTYLNIEKILEIASRCGAEAIHPGYGFLSENASFVSDCEAAGIAFVGPTAKHMLDFGLKHKAREIAESVGVPLPPGTGLLTDLSSAVEHAAIIGYPLMLKSTAGGGGIGMEICHSEADLRNAYDKVKKLGGNNFSNDGVFIEKFIARARHIEVQVFGDGYGQVVAIGERDCSAQRRNQKVVEECPAPNLPDSVRHLLYTQAEDLLSAVSYRNAGTVEFIYDQDSREFYFLEVNTRLQVEHGVTEAVWGIDLVAWMLMLASGDLPDLAELRKKLVPNGHAVQVRVYAEDPYRQFQPCAGLLSKVAFPTAKGLRIDHWLDSGIEVSPYFDPMLAKVIFHAPERNAALKGVIAALDETELYGIVSNRDYLRALLHDPLLKEGLVTTRYLNDFVWQPHRIDVLQAGTQTTVQDYPGRSGYWDVGVPPSGPFDNYSFRLVNRLLGNDADAAGLEITLQGPSLQFSEATDVVIGGAEIPVTLCSSVADSNPISIAPWQVIHIEAGQILQFGRINQGARAYLAVAGGIQCPAYLGSRSTFTLGQFGGHSGRALRVGDVLSLSDTVATPQVLPEQLLPQISNEWTLRVIYGPHGAPDFFTEPDIEAFFSASWEVHYNSSRTGVRLIGPKPKWARDSGGEAGMHPSNIHDNAYAFGTVDFTGDMPVILGPDGPSLGGFVCPATVITADLWKLGQLRAGDKLRFEAVTVEDAVSAEQAQQACISSLSGTLPSSLPLKALPSPIVQRLSADEVGDEVVYRVAGDHFLLVEYGPQELDIRLRFRAHALMQYLQKNPIAGVREMTPGIRSLQLHYDSQVISLPALLEILSAAERQLATQLEQLSVPSRTVYLPLSWDDEACRQAIVKYQQSVRENAPWCPSNLEFIRRINGVESIDTVKEIVFDASYLVMGLGDVYLGAPVATPVDPRHRLVTTKYNPARTWTAENSVGIGGSYLCVYGMEGPGGYQFIGRTLQMWNRYRRTTEFTEPYLLRFFDQIRFYEVSQDELLKIRNDFPLGKYPLRIEEGTFSLAAYQQMLQEKEPEITAHTAKREQAFAEELARWHADGQFHYEAPEIDDNVDVVTLQEGEVPVDSSVAGSVWQLLVKEGDLVEAGQALLLLESMKMEIAVFAPQAGRVKKLLLREGARVSAGQSVLILEDIA